MRAAIVLGLVVALLPSIAGAQGAGPKSAGSSGGVTKEQYIEQANQRAAKRFDKLDTNHDGVLSSDEQRAARKKKSAQD
jgi:hypothetical protein